MTQCTKCNKQLPWSDLPPKFCPECGAPIITVKTDIDTFSDNKEFDFLIFIGKMRPIHRPHQAIVKYALTKAHKVIALVGSSYQPRTPKIPWTWEEVGFMLRSCFEMHEQHNLIIDGLRDYIYNNQKWAKQVQDTVQNIIDVQTRFDEKENLRIGIIGHKKDDTSFYLDMFPQWELVEVDNMNDVNARDVRSHLFDPELNFADVDNILPPSVTEYLTQWQNTSDYDYLVHEYEFLKRTWAAWANTPYPAPFITADGIVIQSGHILLVRRRHAPGKGLWALPGGYVNMDETFLEAMLRELREETRIKVPVPVLRGNIKSEKMFDAPSRSLRGRIVTMGYHIELPSGKLPKVKGTDDAEKARWFPLNDVFKMSEVIFEDHLDIINYFVG